MKIETPDINIPDEFKMSKTSFACLITSKVAAYGAGYVISNIAKFLTANSKLHHKIAVQVASYVVIWACSKWIEKKAIECTVEFINAWATLINLFRNNKTA